MPRGRTAPAVDRLAPPVPSRADFHAHTRRSDGLLEPAELAAAAAAAGVRALAISDHDTLAGYRELVASDAPPLPAGLELVAAVEINAVTPGRTDLPGGELHLIGLGVDPAAEPFEALLASQRGARRRRFERLLARLREIGMAVDDELADLDPDEDDSLGRPTIARALVRAGHASSTSDAFARIVGQGMPGYVPREGIGPLEAIGAIAAAGGIPVLAHFAAAPEQPALLDELIAGGLRGIEVHHRTFGRAQVEAMRAVAAGRRLLPSGGTDFHGDEGSYAEAIAETWVPQEVADRLMGAIRAGAQPAGEMRR